MTETARPRRSVLYVPADKQKALGKIAQLECDSVILDLEDSVSPSAKSEARRMAAQFLSQGGGQEKERVVRINAMNSEWGSEDIRMVLEARPDGLLVPKIDEAEQIREIAETVAPGENGMGLWAMIETPRAIVNLGSIARLGVDSGNGLACLVVGHNDLVKETGIKLPQAAGVLEDWLGQIVIHAKAFGLDALAGVYNAFRDLEGYQAECARDAAIGFDGKTLIHPSQIEGANTSFSPAAEEVEQARAIVAAFDQPENRDKGVISLDGEMVERLHLQIARKVLAKAQR